MSGPLNVSTENWGLLLRNGTGADNAQPQSGVGSAYVNDIYIRSIGKWASQLGGANPQLAFINSYNTDTGALTNDTGNALYLSVSGGGGECGYRNSANLIGYVNGNQVAYFNDNGNQGAHSAFISFFVPVGATYRVTSNPYACPPSSIYLVGYVF